MASANLEVVLELTSLFAGAAKEAASQLDQIGSAIDDLGKKSVVLDGLAEAVKNLDESIKTSEGRISGLSSGLGNVAEKSAAAARETSTARSSFASMGSAAKAATEGVAGVARGVENLEKSAAKVGVVTEKVADVAKASEKAQRAVQGLLGSVNQADRGSFSALMNAARTLESNVMGARRAVQDLNASMIEASKIALGMTPPPRQIALPPSMSMGYEMPGYAPPESRQFGPRRMIVPVGEASTPVDWSGQKEFPRRSTQALTGDRYGPIIPVGEASTPVDWAAQKRLNAAENMLRLTGLGGAQSSITPVGEASTPVDWAAQKRLNAAENMLRLTGLGGAQSSITPVGEASTPVDWAAQKRLNAADEILRLTGDVRASTQRNGVNDARNFGGPPSNIVPVGEPYYNPDYGPGSPYTDARFRDSPSPRERRGRNGKYGINVDDYSVATEGLNAPGAGIPAYDEMDAEIRMAQMKEHMAQMEKNIAGAEKLNKTGDRLQSVGTAGLVNAAMVMGLAAPAFSSAVGVQQLDTQNEVTARANNANTETVKYLHDIIHQIAQRNGGDYSNTIAGAASFIGSMTPSADINNRDWQKSITFALDRASKLSVVSTAGGNALTMQQATIGTNQAIANLGYDTSTPKAFGEAVKDVTNMLVKMKNVTPSNVSDTLAFFKAVGPIGALDHMDPADMAGLVYALGKEKMVGSTAGNAVKRLMQRETLPVKKTHELQDFIKKKTGADISMYDAQGHARSILEVLGSVSEADKKGHWSDKVRSQVVGQLSGLYANAPIGAALSFVEGHGGAKGIHKKGEDIIHGGITGSKQDTLDAEFQKQSQNVGVASQNAASKIKEAWQSIFDSLSPTFVKIAHGIGDVADWFRKLPAPLRDGIVEFALFSGVASLVIGTFKIFIGNNLKMAGSFARMFFEVRKGTGALAENEKVAKGLGGVFIGASKGVIGMIKGFMGARVIGPIFAGITAAVEAFAAFIGVGILPAIAIIGAVAVVAGVVWEAWHTNFGNCQNLFHNLVTSVQTGIKNMNALFTGWREWVGKEVGGVIGYLQVVWKVFGGISEKVDNFFGDWGKRGVAAADALISGIKSKISGVHLGFVHIGLKFDSISNSVKQHAADAMKAAKKFFHPDKQKGALTDDEQDALAKLGRDFGGGGSIPAAAGGAETPGLEQGIDAIMNPQKAAKKRKKKSNVPSDVDIKINDISVTDIEEEARRIEAGWAKNKVHHKAEWINLQDNKGNVEDRVYGDSRAYHQAKTNLLPDKGIEKEAKEYLLRVKYWRKSVEEQVQDLLTFFNKAKSTTLRAWIQEQIADIDKINIGNIKKLNELDKQVHERSFGTEGTPKIPTGGYAKDATTASDDFVGDLDKANRSYEELERNTKSGIETAESLKEKYNLLSDEVTTLSTKNTDLSNTATKLTSDMTAQAAAEKLIVGNSNNAVNARKLYNDEMSSEKNLLSGITTDLNSQGTAIQNVTNLMDVMNQRYLQAIANAKSFTGALQLANQTASQAVTTEAGNLISQGITQEWNHLQSDSGRRRHSGVSPFSKMEEAYVSSYAQSIGDPLAKQVFGMMGAGGAATPILDTQGNALQTTANNLLTDIKTNTAATRDSSQASAGASNDQAKSLAGVQVNTASTATNTQPFSGIVPNSDGTLPVNVPTQYAMTSTPGTAYTAGDQLSSGQYNNGVGNMPDLPTLGHGYTAITEKTISGIAGAISATIAGSQEGGVGGALTAGLGSFAAFAQFASLPVAIGAGALSAVATLFGDHTSPATSPDIYDTQQYGQEEANLQGSGYNQKAQFSANGAYFVQDNQTAQATNNLGLIQYIQQWAANNVNNSDASIAKAAQTDVSQYGAYNANVTDPNQIISYDKNVGQEKVVGGSEAGNFTDIYNAATIAAQQIQQLGSASLQAAQNAQELAASFTANMFGGPAGFSIPYLGSVGGGNASSMLPASAAGIGGTTSLQGGMANPTTQQTVTVNLLQGATVQNGTDITTAINNAVPIITAAINQSNYNTGRYMQNYQSQLS